MNGECILKTIRDEDGKKRGVEILQADDEIRISVSLLQSIDTAVGEYTDEGLLKIRGINREVHYQVGISLDDHFGYYLGRKVFDSAKDESAKED